MSVADLYDLILFIANKNQAGGIKVDDFQDSYNTAQSQYFSDLVGRFQQYQYGRPIPRVGLGDNETVMTKLSPFIMNATVASVSGNTAPKPDDFIRLLAMRYGSNKVYRVEHDKVWSALSSYIDPPSTTNVYYVEYDDSWTIYPTSGIASVVIDYLRKPADVVWAYTVDGDGRFAYTSSGSVDPEWDDVSAVEIATRALKILGVHFKDSDFASYGQSVINTGE